VTKLEPVYKLLLRAAVASQRVAKRVKGHGFLEQRAVELTHRIVALIPTWYLDKREPREGDDG